MEFVAQNKLKTAACAIFFREEGGGRKLDPWWEQVEPHLLARFQSHRAAGCVVLRCHLFVWVLEICCELGIDLDKLKIERGWKDFRANLRRRVCQFCKRNKIKMKRASRQVYKDPKVNCFGKAISLKAYL